MLIEEKDIEVVDIDFIIETVAHLTVFKDVDLFTSTYNESSDREKMYIILCIFDSVSNVVDTHIKKGLSAATDDIKYLKNRWFRPLKPGDDKDIYEKFNPIAGQICKAYKSKYFDPSITNFIN